MRDRQQVIERQDVDRERSPGQAATSHLASLSATFNNSSRVMALQQLGTRLNQNPVRSAPVQAKSQEHSGTVVQRVLIGEVGDEPEVTLDTYEKVVDYIESDKTIEYNFLEYRADAKELVERFIEKNDGTYESPSDLLRSIENFANEEEAESESDQEDHEEPLVIPRKRHVKNKDKSTRKGNARLRVSPGKSDAIMDKYALMSGDEITKGLNSINDTHIDLFSNLYQCGKESDFRHFQGRSNLKDLRKAADFLENDKADVNYKNQLELATAKILAGKQLVRKMSKAESAAYQISRGTEKDVFRKGSEGMKAFRIDETYSFSSTERNNREGDYDVVMLVNLSPKLKTYFINFLSPNTSNPLGVQDKSMQFGINPQFKFEGDDVTILIPPSGWAAFWSFVANDVSFKDNASP